tara:strand:+ start:4607 stop:5848 length:1242 start_codon:yes stop_codon:yes gene_type:complete
MRMLGPSRLTLRETYTLAGQDFLVLTANRENGRETVYHGPKKPYNVQFAHYLGEAGWIAIEARPGDRPAGDSLLVNRVGLDGWIDSLPNGDRLFHTKFQVVFLSGCTAVDSTNWLNFFELHAHKIPGVTEFEGSGPVRLSYEWSSGSSLPIFRVYNQLQTYDANGLATGGVQEIVFQASSLVNPAHQLVENVKYEFEIDMYCNDTNGYLHIKKDGVLIVDLNDRPIGYGVERRQYPQFRIYRAHRTNTAKLLVKILEVTSPKVPDLPGVTRGPELIRDGRFPVTAGAWLDIDSDPDCGMTWMSDGAGGGFMQSYTTGGASDLDQQARFKRRLDILEIGETYELKHSGTFGLGAARTDGGYFSPSTRYLKPENRADGGEMVRQFVATSETLFLGASNPINARTLDGVSLKRVIA